MARAESEQTKVGDKNTAAVADENVRYLSAPVYEKAQLPPDLLRQLGQAPGRLWSYDLLHAGLAPAQTLDPFELACFQAGLFSLDLCYGFLLAANVTALCSSRKEEGRLDSRFQNPNSRWTVQLDYQPKKNWPVRCVNNLSIIMSSG